MVPTAAAADDAAPTLAYLQADRALFKGFRSQLVAAERSANSFVGRMTDECPGVAAHAPANEDLVEFVQESLYATAIAFDRPYEPTVLAFAQDTERLRWSSHRLTRLVRLHAASERAQVTLVLPHLCSDLGEWVASGYGALPPSTTAFLRKQESVSEDGLTRGGSRTPEEEILVLLRRYAGPQAKGLLRSVQGLAASAQSTIGNVLATPLLKMQEGLGLRRSPQPAHPY